MSVLLECEPCGQIFGSPTGYWCRLVGEDFDREIRVTRLPNVGLFLDLYSPTHQDYRKVLCDGGVLTGTYDELMQEAVELSRELPALERH